MICCNQALRKSWKKSTHRVRPQNKAQQAASLLLADYGDTKPATGWQPVVHLNMSDLQGWRIAITRAREQSASINSQLSNLGATIINIPTIEIVAPLNWSEVDLAIETLSTFDWLILTSVNGVDFFFQRLKELKDSTLLPLELKVCTVGVATSNRLENIGIKVDLIPAETRGEGLLKALRETIGADKISGLRFLFPRAQQGRDELPNGLRQVGAMVDVVEAYRTIIPSFDKQDLIKTLQEKIDIIVFTSPSSIRHLSEMVGGGLTELLSKIHIACIGPTTREQANNEGLDVAIEPASQSIENLVDAILSYAKNPPAGRN